MGRSDALMRRGKWMGRFPLRLGALMAAVIITATLLQCRRAYARPNTRVAAQHPVPVGADSYLMWDRWPDQRIGVRAYMRSTYDRAGGNEWADASHFLYQLTDDRNITLDVAGPGILYFVRTNHWHGSPWHYEVDGTDHVVEESSTRDPLHPVANSVFLPQNAFFYPLAVTWSQTKGADLSWVPIGFHKSFRMAYGRTFYGTGYYIYHQFVEGTPMSRPIASWEGKSAPDPRIMELIDKAGTDIAPPVGRDGVREAHGSIDLEPKMDALIWSVVSGPSIMRALEFSVPRSNALLFSHARLRVTWDNQELPSVDAPIALFYGAGVLYNRDNREYLVKSLPMVIRYDAERVYLSCYFPMPFFRSARVSLSGVAEHRISDVRWSVRYASFKGAPNDVGYFHATYRDHPAPEMGKDLELLDTRKIEGGGDWSGSFVGTSFIFSHEAELSTLEGDPRFFFDDSQTPQAQGTGTEEWAGGGDYWGGENMSLAFVGHPVGAKNLQDALRPEDNIESAYRFLLADLMPFGKNAVIRLEHGGENESREHYETVAYWYGLPAASLIKTDELAVGDEESEAHHQYVSPDASPPYDITSRYEWGPDTFQGKEVYPATTDRGRTTKTASEFTLHIDPANVGVMLRRKLDYAYPNQRAEVFVKDSAGPSTKWIFAGIWYTAGSNATVDSYGGVGAELIALDRLSNVLEGARRVRKTIEGGETERIVPTFIERAEALAEASDPATSQDLSRLQDLARYFVSGDKNEDREVVEYAKALDAALEEVLRDGYNPDMSRILHDAELGPTEHIVSRSNRRFRDDEFLIPRRLTEGRSIIHVRVKFTPVNIPLFPGYPLAELALSEIRYTAFSFVMPAFKPH
jgi:Protein of unknown function (DUF2961)